jgi:hypothetical protein
VDNGKIPPVLQQDGRRRDDRGLILIAETRSLFCIFQFPDKGAQIPCYLRLNAMRWLLKTALPAAYFDVRGRKSSTRFRCSGRKTGIFDAKTGSHPTASTTIQSSRTAETVVDRKEAVSAGIVPPVFKNPGLCPH